MAARHINRTGNDVNEGHELTHIDLFSGIGGFALAAQWAGFRTVAFCEIEPYAQRILSKNFGAEAVGDAERAERRKNDERGGYSRERKNEARQTSGRVEQSGSDVANPPSGARELQQSQRQDLRDESAINGSARVIGDIRNFDGTAYRGATLLTGGFPCQPFSVAGKRRGAADDRHLWPEMLRVIAEARPAWVLGENVAGFASMAQFDVPLEVDADGAAIGEVGDLVHRVGRGIADEAVESLEAIGYAVKPFLVPALAVDAKHRRDRIWIVGRNVADLPRIQSGRQNARTEWERTGAGCESTADCNSDRNGEPARALNAEVAELCADVEHAAGERRSEGRSQSKLRRGRDAAAGSSRNVPDASGSRLEGQRSLTSRTGAQLSNPRHDCRWQPEPDVGRVAHGIPARVDRLRGLGNAIVPQVAYQIIKAIYEIETIESLT